MDPCSRYSVGLYLAVSCLDYPQLFSMRVPQRARADTGGGRGRADRGRSRRSARLSGSLRTRTPRPTRPAWLADPDRRDPARDGAPPLLPPNMPVLVLAGNSTPGHHRRCAPDPREVGGHPRFVELANSTHVVGEGDSPAAPPWSRSSSVGPTRSIRWTRRVPRPYRRSGPSGPIRNRSPGSPRPRRRRTTGPPVSTSDWAAARVATAGDAVARSEGIGAVPDVGLHGGTVRPGLGGDRLVLVGDQLVPGVAVSGTVHVGATTVTAWFDGGRALGHRRRPGRLVAGARGRRRGPGHGHGRRTGARRCLPRSLTASPAAPGPRAHDRRGFGCQLPMSWKTIDEMAFTVSMPYCSDGLPLVRTPIR